MAETEISTPQEGPASESAAVLDGILENAIGINREESSGNEDRPTSEMKTSVAEDEAEQQEVETDDPSPDTAQATNSDSAEATPDEREPEPEIEAPKTWPKEHRELFNALPNEQKMFMVERDKERNTAFQRKTTELAEQRKQYDALIGVVQPYREQIAANGLTPHEYLARLMTYDTALRQNPRKAIAELAQHYGVPLDSDASYDQMGADYDDEDSSSPQFQQLKQELDQVKNHLIESQQVQTQQMNQNLERQVEKFRSETDADGNILRPHFDKLRMSMAKLVSSGQAEDLNKAYKMAVRLDDELFEETITTERKSVAQKEEDRRKQAVAKAKKAVPSRSPTPPKGSTKKADLDSVLREKIQGVLT